MLFFILPTFLFIIITILNPASPYTTNGYFIQDLETPTLTASEIAPWALTAMQGASKTFQTLAWSAMPATWILGGPYILGPPGQGSASGHYFSRTYSDIKPHTYVAFTFTVWYFDNWRGVNDQSALTWYIDNTAITGPRINYGNDFWSYEGGLNDFSTGAQTEDCGFVHVKTGTAHTGSTMTFKITGNMVGERVNERFGFRDISFIFHNTTGSPSTPCHLSKELYLHSNFAMLHDRCQCDIDEYISGTSCVPCPARWKSCWVNNICLQCDPGLYWSGTDCCHQYCKTCTGTTSNSCPTCHPDYYNYGNNTCKTNCPYPFKEVENGDQRMCKKPCPDNQFYYAFNDSCVASCPLPLKTTTDVGNGIKYCSNPCSPDTLYLYQNTSCIATCPAPLVSRTEPGVIFCFNPCSGSDYLFFNSTCHATCTSPLQERTEPNVKYCFNPCSSDTLYLYTNVSCFATCPAPLVSRTEPGAIFCFNPCTLTQFLFPNSTCHATCPLPLLSRTEPDVKYCFNPCSATEQYLYQDSTCMNNCLSPLAHRIEPDVQYCWNPCPNPLTDFLFTNGSCKPSCPSPLGSRQDPGVKYCYNPCPNPNNQYLYTNGTCLPTCNDPLTKRSEPGVDFCENPCLNPTDYLHANKSCLPGCVSPLVKKIDPLIQYCRNPCGTDAVYLHMNGSCLPNCVAPLISRSEPSTKYCFTPCSSTQWLFTNSTCVNHCLPPLISKTESGIAYCYNPCHSDTLFLYTNGTCHSTCPSPLVSRLEPEVKFCFTPCPTGQYLYPNQTCSARCDSPLVSRTESGVVYCFNPCPDDTLFLFPNRSCFSNCPYPMVSRSEDGTKYCLSPCPTGHFLYPNQSCSASCLSPLVSKSEPDVNFCFNPCLDPNNEFLFPDRSCFSQCPAPLVSRSEPGVVKFCFNPCPNPTTDFLYPNRTCSSQCNNPLVTKIEPDVMYCLNPCPTTSLFLYGNQSCLTKCVSPLVVKSEGVAKFCFNPCLNPSTDYLYTNGSCLPTCIFPLASRLEIDVQYCFNPCQPNQFLYPNQTCASQCPSPLVSRTESGIKYCFNPCPDPAADFLHTNGSCLATCPPPLYVRTEPGVKYCHSPCPSNKKYLYPNGSCIANCPSPLLQRNEPNVFYCYLPCASPDPYWYINGSCLPTCNSPYQQVVWSGVTQCLAPCRDPSYFYYEHEKACFSRCEYPYINFKVEAIKVCYSNLGLDLDTIGKLKDTAESIAKQGKFTSGGMKAAGALNSNNPSSALLSGLSSMLQYIRYMKINYPPKVETLFMVSADAPISISFDFDIPPAIDEKMDDYPLPYNFDKYDINSNFVRNMWDLIGSFIASIAAIFGLFLATKVFKKCPKIRVVFQKFLGVAKWNIPAMMLCSSSGDIFFFASLHLNVLRFTDAMSVICFLILIFMVGTTLGLWVVTLRIVWTFHKVKKSSDSISLEESGFKEKWGDYELLYAESEEKSILTIAYMTFFITRGFIFNLTIGCLYEYPLIQVGIINASNFLMFGYLIVYRPLKEFVNLVQVFINEAMIIILSVSVLILATMDRLGIVGTKTRVNVGEAILFVIQAFNTIGLVFMGIQLLMMLIFAVKAIKYFREKGIKNPLKMLQVIAFEEFEHETGSDNFLASAVKGGKKQRILKPPRKEKPVYYQDKKQANIDLHNTSSANLITEDLTTHNVRRLKKRMKTTFQSQTTEVEFSESRLDLSFRTTSPAASPPQKENDIHTFRFDPSEIMNQHNPTEEEIRNSLHKSKRKLRLREQSSSPGRKLSQGSFHGEQPMELENQPEMTRITLFPEPNSGGVNDTNTINLFSEAHDTITVKESSSIFDSLRKLKERRNKVNSAKQEPEGTNKAWFSKIRKFKDYLKKKE